MEIRKQILTENECYKVNKKINVKGIMVHSTGANNPNLKRYVGPDDGILGHNQYGNHWNQHRPNGRQVCVHAFIGKDKNGKVRTYQTLPWDHRGWHAGGKANDTHIGFEICEDGLTDKNYFEEVYEEAIQLCVHLCKLYKLTEKDIIGHVEGGKKGIASNSSDPENWFSKHGRSMDTLRAEVKVRLKGQGGNEMVVYRRNSKGAGVKQLQSNLIMLNDKFSLDLNKSFLSYGADGSFGPATEKAVKEFQAHYKLQVDGIAGPATQKKIKELLAAQTSNKELEQKIDKLQEQIKELNLENILLKNKIDKIKEIIN